MAQYTGQPKGTVNKTINEMTTSTPGHANSFNPYWRQIVDNDAELEKRVNDHKNAAVLDHPDGSVTTEKIADGAVTAAKVAADVAKKADLDAHANTTIGAHGATSEAKPNTIVQRDSAGRFKAAAPSASDDVARKAETDAAMAAAQAAQNTANAALPASQYTASDILTKLKTVDGASSGLDADLLDGMQPSTSAIANTIVQRDSEGNIRASRRIYFSNDDYIEFDDSTDTYSFKDDGGSTEAQDSNIRAGRIRLTVTSDASETSTNHAFQIGPDNGENIRIDTNEILFVNNGVFGQGYIHGSRIDLANSVRGNNGGNAQARMGNTWYDIWHKGNLPYEIGSWTPNVEIGGVRASYARRSGTYIRIGNLLYWSFYIELSSKNNGTEAVAIGAFPFPLAPENGTIPMGKITNVGYFPQGTRWAYLHLPWNGATFFWLRAVSDVFTGDVSLTGYHLTDNSILAASGVCRIAG